VVIAADDGPQHYFDTSPDAPSERSTIEMVLPDLSLELTTDRGVFGRHKLDPGTKLLLLDGPEPIGGDRTLLDIGAGYGPIAVTLAMRNPGATVWAVDVNERARDLCRHNAAAAGLTNVEVAAPDDVPDDLRFDRIWSNPPIRIGKNKLQQLLSRWLGHLQPTGSAHLVVQKHLGSDSLQRWLTTNGWPTERRSSRAGYRLLDVHARSDAASPGHQQPEGSR
jgi:16S rRNA G1207 methylase RsmC